MNDKTSRQPLRAADGAYICPDCRLQMTKLDWLIHRNRRCGSMVDDITGMVLAALCLAAFVAMIVVLIGVPI